MITDTNREEQIYAAGEEILSERLTENMKKITADFKREPNLYDSHFSAKIQELMKKAETLQKPVRYLCFSFLQSSLYTKSYEYRIDAYDDTFYKDSEEICICWKPDFIFRYYEQDVEYFKKQIGTKVPRVKEYEIVSFCSRYAMHYHRITQQFIHDQMKGILSELSFNEAFSGKLSVMFGGLYDKSIMLLEKDFHP